MTEILIKPKEPGLYWCRYIPSNSECFLASVEDVDMIRYFNCCMNECDYCTPASNPENYKGEYIRIERPDWPDAPEWSKVRRALVKHGNKTMYAITCYKGENVSVMDGKGNLFYPSPRSIIVIPHPDNDSELVRNIEESQANQEN